VGLEERLRPAAGLEEAAPEGPRLMTVEEALRWLDSDRTITALSTPGQGVGSLRELGGEASVTHADPEGHTFALVTEHAALNGNVVFTRRGQTVTLSKPVATARLTDPALNIQRAGAAALKPGTLLVHLVTGGNMVVARDQSDLRADRVRLSYVPGPGETWSGDALPDVKNIFDVARDFALPVQAEQLKPRVLLYDTKWGLTYRFSASTTQDVTHQLMGRRFDPDSGTFADKDTLLDHWGIVSSRFIVVARPVDVSRRVATAGLEEVPEAADAAQIERWVAERGGVSAITPAQMQAVSRQLRTFALSPERIGVEAAMRAQETRMGYATGLRRAALGAVEASGGAWARPDSTAPLVFVFEGPQVDWTPFVAQAGAPVGAIVDTVYEADGLKTMLQKLGVPERQVKIVSLDVAGDRDQALQEIQQHFSMPGLPAPRPITFAGNASAAAIEQALRGYGLSFTGSPTLHLRTVEQYLSAAA
jgi:hypothetical protein